MGILDIVERAIQRAGGIVGAARALQVNPNTIRQWRLEMSLPTPEKEAGLAALADVTADAVEDAIRNERLRRWEARRRRELRPRPTLGASGSAAAPWPKQEQASPPQEARGPSQPSGQEHGDHNGWDHPINRQRRGYLKNTTQVRVTNRLPSYRTIGENGEMAA